MDSPSLSAVLRARLQRLEPDYRRARSADVKRGLLYLALVLMGIPVLAAAGLGAVWLLGNYVTQHPAAVGATGLGALVAAGILGYFAARAIGRVGAGLPEAYPAAFRDTVLLPSLSEAVPRCRVTPDPLDPEVVRASELFRTTWNLFESPCTFRGEHGCVAYTAGPLRMRRNLDHAGRKTERMMMFFRGYFLHIAAPVPMESTFRVVDPVYEDGDRAFRVQRWPGTVRTATGDAAFDSRFWIVLNEDAPQRASCPPGLHAELPAIASQIQLPLLLALNQAGIFLAICTPGSRVPLDQTGPDGEGAGHLTSELLLAAQIPAIAERLLRAVRA